MIRHFRIVALCSISALAAALPHAAMAQVAQASTAPQADDTADVGDIVVTAALREQTLQEVPVAVSVVSGAQLDAIGASSIESVANASPSLTFTKGSNQSNSSLSIRGIGTTVFSAATEPAVSVIVDDVPMARSGQGFQDLIDVQRVEVLRGPQSTLFGKNASAGLVSVTTKAPGRTLTGDFDATYAEGGELQLRGSISGPVSETLGFSLSGFFKDYDGFVENVSGVGDSKLSGYHVWGTRGKLRFEPTNDLEITVIGDYSKGSDTTVPTLRELGTVAYANAVAPVIPSAENRQVNLNSDNTNDSEQWGISARIKARLTDNFELVSISAIRKWDFTGRGDTDYTSLTAPVAGVNLWDVNSGTTSLQQLTQEIRLVSGDLGGFDVLVGAFASKVDIDTTFQRRQVFLAGPRSGQFSGSTSSSNIAAFISTNIDLTENTQLFGGLRVLRETLDWSADRDPADVLVPGDLPLTGATGTAANFSNSTSDTAVVGKIGVRQSLGDLGNVYASYARGYKGKGFNLIFATQPTDQPVNPELSDAFEVGAKVQTLDRKLSLNAALFYTKYRGYQSQARLPGDISFYLLNAGTVSTRGIEVEATVKPTRLLDISLGGTWADARIDEFPIGPCYVGQTAALGCVGGSQNLSGGALPNAPDFRGTFYVRQTVPFGDSMPFDGFIQSNVVYQTKVQYSLDQDPKTIQDGYAVVNAALGLESKDGAYSVSVFVKNLFDKNFTGNLFNSTFNGGRVYQQVLRDGERYFGVRAAVHF
ncbi:MULTISPECIES: TonB-dependent receptor [unclassified Sphingobium]|uniref:TonB-dependent receptor n=1 Tax=unclassified Sphingobium TaxID=2611147 RepID=UPI00222496B4|nr:MULTISPECIES: TonB-dependent receptor plug domain-containing protein [unclassified Sphingobium]MCW2393775.1 iron complex outermembrane receptor protein [Sphingobium sp. B8D3B]MCW2417289.1 iron complex outermembrane receptor protein [Sphingobium sp. B8D3C]